MVEDNIKFGVGCSTNWDPTKAGREAIVKALQQIDYKPKFLLIFSTIHYAKEKGGLQKLLNSCRCLVNDKVPSIGGTVTGFICPEGCHTRGVVVVASKGDIDVSADYGEKVIYNPTSIGRKIGKTISRKLKDSKKRNKLLVEFTTGPTEPTWIASPRIYNFIKYFYKKFPLRISWFLRDMILKSYITLFPSGPGMEEEVLFGISENLDEYHLFGCSTFDDTKCLKNYQFYNNKILHNSTVAIGLALDKEIITEQSTYVIPTEKKVNIKRGWGGYMIDLINNKPATDEYIKEMGWPAEYIKENIEQVTRKTFYYPLGFRDNNKLHPFATGFFFGESIVTNRKIKKDEIEFLLTSAKKLVSDFDGMLKKLEEKETVFTIVATDQPPIGILGVNINILKKALDKSTRGSPYLMLFGVGEHLKMPYEAGVFENGVVIGLSIRN